MEQLREDINIIDATADLAISKEQLKLIKISSLQDE